MITNAGDVKTTPAAIGDPAAAPVCSMLFLKMVPPQADAAAHRDQRYPHRRRDRQAGEPATICIRRRQDFREADRWYHGTNDREKSEKRPVVSCAGSRRNPVESCATARRSTRHRGRCGLIQPIGRYPQIRPTIAFSVFTAGQWMAAAEQHSHMKSGKSLITRTGGDGMAIAIDRQVRFDTTGNFRSSIWDLASGWASWFMRRAG